MFKGTNKISLKTKPQIAIIIKSKYSVKKGKEEIYERAKQAQRSRINALRNKLDNYLIIMMTKGKNKYNIQIDILLFTK